LSVDRHHIDDQMRRLVLARWLTTRVANEIGETVPADASPESLEELASRLDPVADNRMPFADVRFEPPYPGRIVEDATHRSRLVLECSAGVEEDPLGVVLTVLIAGRRPEVSIAPPSARARRGED
jgi:hypothetical protein